MAAHEVLKISRNIALQGRKEFESGRTPQPRVEKLISPVWSGLHVDDEEILVRNRSKRDSVLTVLTHSEFRLSVCCSSLPIVRKFVMMVLNYVTLRIFI